MKNLVELVADYVYLGTGSRIPANKLYDMMGFNMNDTSYKWSLIL